MTWLTTLVRAALFGFVFALPIFAAASSREPRIYASTSTHFTAPSSNMLLLSKAKEWFWRFESDNIDRSQLDSVMNSQMTTARVSMVGSALRRLGTPMQFSFLGSTQIGNATSYNFVVTCKSGKALELLAFDPSGSIVGINFQTFVSSKIIKPSGVSRPA